MCLWCNYPSYSTPYQGEVLNLTKYSYVMAPQREVQRMISTGVPNTGRWAYHQLLEQYGHNPFCFVTDHLYLKRGCFPFLRYKHDNIFIFRLQFISFTRKESAALVTPSHSNFVSSLHGYIFKDRVQEAFFSQKDLSPSFVLPPFRDIAFFAPGRIIPVSSQG